jgi:AraC-like DNA-binding protein
LAGLKPPQLLEAPGLRTVLRSNDFGQWDSQVASSLGHHRSRLLPGSAPFEAWIRCGAVEEFQVLLLHGRGQIHLQREQCGHGVLWLPLQGLSQETINGEEHLAEPGMGLVFQPGDAMRGLTSEEVSGISIVVPADQLQAAAPRSPLIQRGRLDRQLISAGLQLAEAAAWRPQGARHAAAALVEALHQWCTPPEPGQRRERIPARRRRSTVANACRWMEAHLAERFSVVELSQALGVSVRTLQYSFQQELGHAPMVEAKRLRLRQLRRFLLDPGQQHHSIAALMDASGLLACGITAADYRRWCGESPKRTRAWVSGSRPMATRGSAPTPGHGSRDGSRDGSRGWPGSSADAACRPA